MKKELFIIGLVGFVSIIIVPLILFKIVYCSTGGYFPDINNTFIYFATITGSCFSGFITAAGLYETLKQTRQIQDENKNLQEIYERRQKEIEANRYMPILDISDVNPKRNSEYEINKLYTEDESIYFFLYLKNKGEIACNLDSYSVKITTSSNGKDIELTNSTQSDNCTDVNVISKNESTEICFQILDESFKGELDDNCPIMINIIMNIRSALNYRYTQYMVINTTNRVFEKESIKITLPEYIKD